MEKLNRRPRKWASQRIIFDVVLFTSSGKEVNRRACFICKKCRHICAYDTDSLCYRCVRCGRKLTVYGAKEIVERYIKQFEDLNNSIQRGQYDLGSIDDTN